MGKKIFSVNTIPLLGNLLHWIFPAVQFIGYFIQGFRLATVHRISIVSFLNSRAGPSLKPSVNDKITSGFLNLLGFSGVHTSTTLKSPITLGSKPETHPDGGGSIKNKAQPRREGLQHSSSSLWR